MNFFFMNLVLLPYTCYLNRETIILLSVFYYKGNYLLYLLAILFFLAYEKKILRSENCQPCLCE